MINLSVLSSVRDVKHEAGASQFRRIQNGIICHSEQMLNTFDRKILRRIYGPTQEGGDAGIPDGIMNCTAYTRSQILWRTSKLEDYNGRVI
jgi:hypothetical protein